MVRKCLEHVYVSKDPTEDEKLEEASVHVQPTTPPSQVFRNPRVLTPMHNGSKFMLRPAKKSHWSSEGRAQKVKVCWSDPGWTPARPLSGLAMCHTLQTSQVLCQSMRY